eukprot:Nitzschia sp. Nitz4//scaffold1_size375055//334432//337716//NITZ4_000335-RA/size375055-augustus-gene-0.695-mRNA-1//1//CDS//3329541222//6404//frame0
MPNPASDKESVTESTGAPLTGGAANSNSAKSEQKQKPQPNPKPSQSKPPTRIQTSSNVQQPTQSTQPTTTSRHAQSNPQSPSHNPSRIADDPDVQEQERLDLEYVKNFWTVYDDIIMLSLCTQLGIMCRLGMAHWLRIFDGVFTNGSALFANLPLNCFSCFVLGLLCSGESLMEIIATRFTPTKLQYDLQSPSSPPNSMGIRPTNSTDSFQDLEASASASSPPSILRHRRQQRQPATPNSARSRPEPDFVTELREVQLLALERRIRLSPCLVLFPVKKEDVDVVENYFHEGYRKNSEENEIHMNTPPRDLPSRASRDDYSLDSHEGFSWDNHDLALEEEGWEDEEQPPQPLPRTPTLRPSMHHQETPSSVSSRTPLHVSAENGVASLGGVDERADEMPETGQAYVRRDHRSRLRARPYGQVDGGNMVDYGTQEHPDLDQIITNVATDVSRQISRIRRVSLAAGWDVGTSPEESSEDLMLGLRDGLCGALSSFSSWISSMVTLLTTGNIGQAFVGLILGIQLPLIGYRFGQHVAVYIFVWRCRRETRRDERRGYGIRLNMDDGEDSDDEELRGISRAPSGDSEQRSTRAKGRRVQVEEDDDSETPSVRAIITAIFIMSLVAQVTALNFFYEPQDRLVALSLLFSPLGVLTRWRLSRLNSWRPSFPIGTFICNIAACALSGSLGSLLAGNPGPRERITLVAIIAGFGGTLSSVARFIVEILIGTDPILLRVDGIYYGVSSVFWGLLNPFMMRNILCIVGLLWLYLIGEVGAWAPNRFGSSSTRGASTPHGFQPHRHGMAGATQHQRPEKKWNDIFRPASRPPKVVVYDDMGPLARSIYGASHTSLKLLGEYVSGFAGGYGFGLLIGVPKLLFSKSNPEATSMIEIRSRLGTLNGNSLKWAYQFGSYGVIFRGSTVLVDFVLQDSKGSPLNQILANALGGALLARKEGPSKMLIGALSWAAISYSGFLLSNTSSRAARDREVLSIGR